MNDEHIKTSDLPYAAFLMLNDFTYLCTVDPEDGSGRYEFYFTHTDKDKREHMAYYASELRDQLQGEDIGFVKFYRNLRTLRKTTYSDNNKLIKASDIQRRKQS